MQTKWHSFFYLIYIHQYVLQYQKYYQERWSNSTMGQMQQWSDSHRHKHVFENTATQFKFSTTRDFKLKLCPHCRQQSSTQEGRQSSVTKQPCKIGKTGQNWILVNQSKNETATKMKVSPLQAAFTLILKSCGWGRDSLVHGKALSTSPCCHGLSPNLQQDHIQNSSIQTLAIQHF